MYFARPVILRSEETRAQIANRTLDTALLVAARTGEAAEELLAQLEDVCSRDEAERRIAIAERFLAKVGVISDDRAAAE